MIYMMNCGSPMNSAVNVIPIFNRPVDEARNILADTAIKGNYKYLLFIDDDVLPPPNTFRRLVWDLENNPFISVVGGIYGVKQDPCAPLLFDAPSQGPSFDWHPGDMRKTWAIGMGLAAIRVADLAKMKPRLKTVMVRDYPVYGAQFEVAEFFRTASDYIPRGAQDGQGVAGEGMAFTCSEDLYFCEQCKQNGLQVYADAGIIGTHIDLNGKKYDIDNSVIFKDPTKGLKHIYLDIGSGSLRRRWEDGTPILRVDADPEVHPDYVQDARKLSIVDGFADGVVCSHLIEHFDRFEAESVLDEIVRVTKDGGSIYILCPDMAGIVDMYKMYTDGNDTAMVDVLRALYGAQDGPFQSHYNVWDSKSLIHAMERRGCKWLSKTVVPEQPFSMEMWFTKGERNLYLEEKQECLTESTPTSLVGEPTAIPQKELASTSEPTPASPADAPSFSEGITGQTTYPPTPSSSCGKGSSTLPTSKRRKGPSQ